jgi:hypothetical protein
MAHYERRRIDRPVTGRWRQVSILSGLVGGVVLVFVGLALLSVLNEAEFAIIDPLGALAMILLTLALPALYASERHWFGRFATVGFGLLAVGRTGATIALPVAIYGPGVAFLVYLLGVLVAMVGALVFGVAILRTDAATTPRLGAWLLVAALPIGVPFALGFTTYVMGEGVDPWAGPMLAYGLAWVVFGRYLRERRTETPATESTPE